MKKKSTVKTYMIWKSGSSDCILIEFDANNVERCLKEKKIYLIVVK